MYTVRISIVTPKENIYHATYDFTAEFLEDCVFSKDKNPSKDFLKDMMFEMVECLFEKYEIKSKIKLNK